MIAAVLIVQCFLFDDGGLTALGANFVNMGLIGAVCGYAIYAPIRRAIGGQKGVLIASMVAAWFSVLLASGAFAIEMAASGHRDDFLRILTWMALVHAVIGVGEALITGLVVRFVLLRRPDLLEPEGEAGEASPGGGWVRPAIAGLAIALGIAVFLGPFASECTRRPRIRRRAGRFPESGSVLAVAPLADGRLPAQSPRAESCSGRDGAGRPGGDAGRLRGRVGDGTRAAARRSRRDHARCGLTGSSVIAPGPDRSTGSMPGSSSSRPWCSSIAVIATPPGAWRGFGVEGFLLAFAIGLAGIPPRELARRWLGLFLLVGFLTLMVAPAHPARARYGLAVVAASILIKNGLALVTMLVLAGTTPFPRLLSALRKLGVPPVLVATLQFMDRYRYVLLDELDRMATARRARTFRRRNALSWSLLGGLIGMLFLRTFERGERVHDAMIARGWSGAIRNLDD